jgi:hypothetical protein
MKSYKQLTEEILSEGGYRYPGDDMTMKELKIAINAAKNILDMLEDGASIQRWQISAIVVASEELASVCTSMRADYDEEMEDEMDMEYTEYGYPSMYGEAVEVRHDRYMRSHGKKANGTGGWFFTHKSGAVNNLDDEKEVHFHQGKFSDAKKAAQQWAKKHGHSAVYVMEEVELDEAIKRLPRKDVMQASKIFADAKKKGSLNSEAEAMVLDFAIKKLKYSKKDAEMLAQKAEVKHIDMVEEEVELDEVSDKMLDRYRQKAFADQPAGDDGSDKYRKRKFGRDLAFAKQTGRAKVLATKEEVELDEGKKKGLWDNIHARRKKGLPPKKPGEEGYPKTLDIGENTNEEIDYKVSVDGLPDMYIKAKSPAEIKTKLRKIVKKPDTIQSVERVTKSMLNKIFRDKAMGKEEPNDTEE